jgi:hypothetical protein
MENHDDVDVEKAVSVGSVGSKCNHDDNEDTGAFQGLFEIFI